MYQTRTGERNKIPGYNFRLQTKMEKTYETY